MKGALRNIKNAVYAYEEIEVKVREATSSDPWGASSTLMSEIAESTHSSKDYGKLFNMLWKRLQDYQHHLHVQKALILIEYLVRNGSGRFVNDVKRRAADILKLKGYRYYNKDNKDIASNIRIKAKMVYEMVNNNDVLKEERAKARRLRGVNSTHATSGSGRHRVHVNPPSNRSRGSYGSNRGSQRGSRRGAPPPPRTPPGSHGSRHSAPRSNGSVDPYDLYSDTSRALSRHERNQQQQLEHAKAERLRKEKEEAERLSAARKKKDKKKRKKSKKKATAQQDNAKSAGPAPASDDEDENPFASAPADDPFAEFGGSKADSGKKKKDKKKKKKKSKKADAADDNPFDADPSGGDIFPDTIEVTEEVRNSTTVDDFLERAMGPAAQAYAAHVSPPQSNKSNDVDFLTAQMDDFQVVDEPTAGRVEFFAEDSSDSDDSDDDEDKKADDVFGLVNLDNMQNTAKPKKSKKSKKLNVPMAVQQQRKGSVIMGAPIPEFASTSPATAPQRGPSPDPFALAGPPSQPQQSNAGFPPFYTQQPQQPAPQANDPWGMLGSQPQQQQQQQQQQQRQGNVYQGSPNPFGPPMNAPQGAPPPHGDPMLGFGFRQAQPAQNFDLISAVSKPKAKSNNNNVANKASNNGNGGDPFAGLAGW